MVGLRIGLFLFFLAVSLGLPLESARGDETRSVPKKTISLWSDPATWNTGRPPGPGDTVVIDRGVSVELDVEAQVGWVTVRGTLTFSGKVSSAMVVHQGSVVIEDGGALYMGTPEDPILRPVTATLEIVVPEGQTYTGGAVVNPENDFGIWVLSGGTFEGSGNPLKNTWSYLAATAQAGTRQVLAQDDVTDWQPGDVVAVTVLRRELGGPFSDPIDFIFRGTVERVEPRSNTNAGWGGSVITLTEALPNTALAEYGFWAAVGNLTRNVVVRGGEANPHDRPHLWHRDGSRGRLYYMEFFHLGPMGDHNFPANDSMPPTDRYPVHYHVSPGEVVGLSLHDNGKNGIVLHRSVGTYVLGNVVAGNIYSGAGIWTGPENNDPAQEAKIWWNMVAFPHSYQLNPENPQGSTFHRPLYLSHPKQSVIGNLFMGGYYTVYAPFTDGQRGIPLEFQYNAMYSGTVGLLLGNYRPPAGSPEIKGNVAAVHDYSYGVYQLENVTFSDCIVAAGALNTLGLQGNTVTMKNCHVFSTPTPFWGEVHRALGPGIVGSPALRLEGTGLRFVDSWITGHYDYAAIDKPYCCEAVVQAEFNGTAFDVDLPYDWWRPPIVSWGTGDQRAHETSLLQFRNYSGIYLGELGASFDTIPGCLPQPEGGELSDRIRDGWLIRRR